MNRDELLKTGTNSRRDFVVRVAAGAGLLACSAGVKVLWARPALAATDVDHASMHLMRTATVDAAALDQTAQGTQAQPGSNAGVLDMDAGEYKRVRLPPKPNAAPLLDKEKVEEFERTIACPCPCTLDVYTCRTTMVSCSISPAVHGDVLSMVNGGYNADEIMQAMTGTYGNTILMAPPKKGVNLIAWFAPFAALGGGAILINAMLRGWRKNSVVAADRALATMIKPVEVGATDDEMARLQKALRDDSR